MVRARGAHRRARVLRHHDTRADGASVVRTGRDLAGRARDSRRGALRGPYWRLCRPARGASVAEFADATAPGLPLASGIGRLGNWFNQELFGGPTSLPWGLKIAPQYRPVHYAAYQTFQPTFLYELTWDIGLAGLLLLLDARTRIRPPALFALYVCLYSLVRLLLELLRVDPASVFLGERLNFWVGLAGVIGGAVAFVYVQWLRPAAPGEAVALDA